jgi:hypothetical protein
MKKALIFLCILFSLSAHAQLNKGDKYIGGFFSGSTSQSDNVGSTTRDKNES